MKGGTTARVAALPCRALLLALVLALLQTSVSATTFTVCDVATQSTDPEVGLLRAGISMAIAGIKSSYSTVTWNFANCDYNSANLGNQMVSAANANSYYLFTGIYDDNDLQSVVSSQSISTSPYIVLGPYTQSQSVRTWSPNVAFTTVDPIAELTILLNYIISLDQKATTTITKFGIMYLTGGAFDGKESAYVISQTTAMGYRTPITYSQPASSAYNAAAYTQFMAESPSTVIILGARGTHTTTFFTNLATAPGSVSLIGSTFGLQYSLVTAYKGITAAGKIASTNVLFTATIPSPSFTKMSLQTLYQTAATSAGFTDPTTSSQSLLRMQGFTSAWMAALTLMTFGKDSSFNNYRKLYAQTFFSQGKFVVQDYVLGVYGNPCSSNAARTGAICNCNQGGHLVTVNSIVDTTFIVSVVSTQWTGTLSCYSSTTVSTYAPLRGIIQNSADPASTAAYTTAKSVFTTQLTTSPGFPYFMSYPTSTAATAGTDLVAYANNQAVSFITGPLSASVSLTDLAAEDVLVVEPVLVDSTNAPVYEPNIIYLTPTLDQQMYVICKYLSSRFGITAPQTAASPASEQVYASFRAQNATQMTLRLRRSLNTFMLRLYNQYDEPLGGTGDLTANLNAAGPTVVLGLVSGEPAKLATFMTANTNSLIVICFDDLTLLFSEFVTAFSTATAAVQQRLLFVTNLPYFYSLPGTGDGSTLFTFLSSQTQASRTPMMARAYLAQQFMQQLGGSNVPVSGSDLVDSLTKTQVYDVGGLTVGPYRPYCLAAPPGVELSCVADYIARNMTVWPSTRIFSASSANPLTDPSTPPLIYGPLYKPILIEPLLPYCTPSGPKKPKYVAQILFISLFALLILLLLLFLILFCCLYGQRDPRLYENAPLTGEAVTLVFVDVEKSAALCEVAPEAAEEELEHLHYYLRFLVGKHRCYEVGALKDAYHFASRSATAAQKLIADLQKHMQNRAKRNKTAKRITQAYGEIMGSEGTVPLERQGLRVRIGMHTGPADAHFNEYTRSYIYVGDTKMMTAAIERRARAGQALMSANAFAALNAEFDDRQMEAEHNNKKFKEERLGATPMGKLQLGRQFPPQEVYLLQSATSKEMAGSSANSSAGSDSTKSSTSEDNAVYLLCRMCSTAPLEHERQVLEVMYSALPAKDRTKALEVLCAENAIEPPHKKLYSNDEEYDTALLYLLAARIAPQITMPFPGEVGMSDSQNNSTEKSRSSNTVEKPSKKAGPRSGDVVDFSSDDNNSHCHSTAQ